MRRPQTAASLIFRTNDMAQAAAALVVQVLVPVLVGEARAASGETGCGGGGHLRHQVKLVKARLRGSGPVVPQQLILLRQLRGHGDGGAVRQEWCTTHSAGHSLCRYTLPRWPLLRTTSAA